MLDKKKWLYENQKYIKGAFIATIIFAALFLFLISQFPKEKIKTDKNKQTYREITYGKKVIQIPVLKDKKMNQEIKKYEKNVLQDKQIEKVHYEINYVGNFIQIKWIETRDGKTSEKYWHYNQKTEKSIGLKDIFSSWNPDMDSKMKKMVQLELERKMRTLTPPLPDPMTIEEYNQSMNEAIQKNEFFLVDNQEESNLYFNLKDKKGNRMQVSVPLYAFQKQLRFEVLGFQKEEAMNRWFQNQNKGRKLVAFTYDDGPNPRTTPGLLKELTKRGVNATFYMLGKNIERNPDVVKMMQSGGFELGSHTYNHKNLKRCTEEEQNFEINGTVDALKKITGMEPSGMRPPYGNYNDTTLSLLKNPIILWDVDTLDWKYRNTDTIIQNSIDHIDDGDIVLFHDIYQTSVDASLNMIDELYKRGYLVMSVSELAKAKQVELKPGMKYYHIG